MSGYVSVESGAVNRIIHQIGGVVRIQHIHQEDQMNIDNQLAVEWAEHGEDNAPLWDYVVSIMDNETRETIHGEIAPCTQRVFWERYRSTTDGRAIAAITEF